MKAIIKDKDKLKQVEIFGIVNNKNWDVDCIYFHDELNKLAVAKMFNTKKYIITNVFMFEEKPKNWIVNKKFEGYNWFDTAKIIQKIKRDENINDKLLEKCKKMQEQVFIPETIQIETKKDLDNLLYLSNNFHDSYVEKIEKIGEKLIIKIDTTWNIKIIFILEGEIENNLEVNYGGYGEIFDAKMFIENSKIYWVNDCVTSTKQFEKDTKYFCAKSISYSYEIY